MTLKNHAMRNILYIIAAVLVIGWAISFIGYAIGGIIHALLGIALILVLFSVFKGRSA